MIPPSSSRSTRSRVSHPAPHSPPELSDMSRCRSSLRALTSTRLARARFSPTAASRSSARTRERRCRRARFQSIQGFNDFNPNTNFHQVITPAEQGQSERRRPLPRQRTLVQRHERRRPAESARRRARRQRRRSLAGRRCHGDRLDCLCPAANRQSSRPGQGARRSPCRSSSSTATRTCRVTASRFSFLRSSRRHRNRRSSESRFSGESITMKGYKAYLLFGIISSPVLAAVRADDVGRAASFLSTAFTRRNTERLLPESRGSSRTPTNEQAILASLLVTWSKAPRAGGIGYYVGGGVKWGHGEGRTDHDGTWGWDETGHRHFRPPGDSRLVRRAQIPGRHRPISHGWPGRSRRDLRRQQHDQSTGPKQRIRVTDREFRAKGRIPP